MPLTTHEREKIALIDKQVKMLQDREANDDVILNALMDFVAETKCIVESANVEELQTSLRKHQGFAYFLSLVSLAMTH